MVEEYLIKIASSLVLTKTDKEPIDISIDYLVGKFENALKDEVKRVELFGSYSRETFLLPDYSPKSDVDIMIVFEENKLKSQTLLTKIKEILKDHYSRSEVYQDHPTIALELNHIKFEISPTKEEWILFFGDTLYIPALIKGEEKWIETEPSKLNDKLNRKDEEENGNLRPLIRLLKYYNAKADYPFTSYKIEQAVLELSYYNCKTLLDYFSYFIVENDLELESDSAKESMKKLQKLKEDIEILIDRKLDDYAIMELHKFFPPIIGR